MKKNIFDAIDERVTDVICKLLAQYDEESCVSIIAMVIDRMDTYLDIKYGTDEELLVRLNDAQEYVHGALGNYEMSEDEFRYLDKENGVKISKLNSNEQSSISE